MSEVKPEDLLTPSEMRTAWLNAKGMRRAAIAREMGGVGQAAVKKHMQFAMQKTGCETAQELAEWFARKYPTEESFAAAYTARCVRVCERMRRRYG